MAQPPPPRAVGTEMPPLALPEAAMFAPLLSESLNGFAVLDENYVYVWVSESMCNLLDCNKSQLLGRPLLDCVYAPDQPPLRALFEAAREAVTWQRPSEAYVRVRHACRAMTAHEFMPVEFKACSDGQWLYCVALDAHMPARMEGMLPDYLLSTSHDLRTPCASIQAASSLLLPFAAVAADQEACSLLRSIDAACTVLMRCVSNVLSMRQLQRDGHITRGALRPFDPRACVTRAVDIMSDFGGVPSRVAWAEPDPLSALPAMAVGDERALEAALLNVLISAVRLGAWMPDQSKVRLRVAALPSPEAVTFSVSVERAASPPGSPPPSADAFVLLVQAETPGRPLSHDECTQMLAPFGMAPADKGGGTGLPLFVVRGIARAMGGDLDLECGHKEGSLITLRIPLRVPDPYMLRHLALSAPRSAEATAAAATTKAHAPQPSEPRMPEAGRFTASLTPVPRADAGAAAAAAARASREQFGKPQLTPEKVSKLELTARMFECLLTNSDDVFAICRLAPERPGDPNSPLLSKIEYISPSVAWRLAFSPQSVLGRDLVDVCHPEDRDAFRTAMQTAYHAQTAQQRRLVVMHRSVTATGEFIWCHSAGMCQGDLLFLVCRDVRTRKSVEVALRVFTLATSHDLREPCNAILVSLAVLEQRPCVASLQQPRVGEAAQELQSSSFDAAHMEPAELVASMRASCALLLGIVSNVLSAPQVHSGELTLQSDVFSPASVLHDVMQACQLGCAAAAAAGGGVQAAPGEPLPPLVEGDSGRMAQVVQNLVTNAIKFNPGVPVRVSATMQPAEAYPPASVPAAAGRPWLVIQVSDRGRGMSAAEAAACFTAGVAALAAVGGGTGLGLYLSQAFAQLMGGSLTVQTAPGQGSTFTLRVPVRVLDPDEVAAVEAERTAAALAAQAERAERAEAIAAVAEGKRVRVSPREHRRALHVLVADDHPLNLRLLTRLLQLHDFLVTAVPDGGAALAALISSQGAAAGGTAAAGGGGGVSAAAPPAAAASGPFDLAILDMEMPVMSGTEVAAAYRRWEAEQAQATGVYSHLPIVALTANVTEEHAAQCESAGMDLFLPKPLRDFAIPALRAQAMAHAEERAVMYEAQAATREGAAVAATAGAAAAAAHAVLGPPALAPPAARPPQQRPGGAEK